jgi:hypothetical protein
MELKNELNKLKEHVESGNKSELKKQIDFIHAHFTSEKDREEIDRFISSGLHDLTEHVDNVISEIEVKIQLMEISKVVSLSYIAKNYFKKTRQWLYQKINGSPVNGKPAKFTPDEIDTFNYALRDISKKIGSLTIS